MVIIFLNCWLACVRRINVSQLAMAAIQTASLLQRFTRPLLPKEDHVISYQGSPEFKDQRRLLTIWYLQKEVLILLIETWRKMVIAR